MKNIKRISIGLQWVFVSYIVFQSLMIVFTWLLAPPLPLKGTFIDAWFMEGFVSYDIKALGKNINVYQQDFSPLARVIGFTGSLILDGLKCLSAFFLIQIFSLYKKGNLFSTHHVKLFKKIGITLFINSTIGLTIADVLYSLALTLDNQPGERMIHVGFGTPNIEMMAISAVIILTSWIMLEGFKLKQDQSLTI